MTRRWSFAAWVGWLLWLTACAKTTPPNVVLISLDTTRADHLGCYGAARPTPNLDALAAAGVLFENAFTPLPITPPAHASMLTGLLPVRHGLRHIGESLPGDLPTLPAMLAAGGYACGAFVSSAVMDRRFGLGRGFSIYDQPAGDERAAEETVTRAMKWISGAERPFFLFLHLYDPHLDYTPPEDFRGFFRDAPRAAEFNDDPVVFRNRVTAPAEDGVRPAPEDAALAADLYDGEIAYVDQQLGRLFASLRERGWWDATVVVVTADHGESFRPDYPFDHGDRLYEEILHVPLLIKAPGVPPGGRIGAAVELTDIAPTLLAMTGRSTTAEFDGENLLPSIAGTPSRRREYLFAEAPGRDDPFTEGDLISVRGRNYKLVHNFGTGKSSLFALVNGAAREGDDLCATRPDACDAYLARGRRWLAEVMPGAPSNPPVDADLRRRLKNLGYVPSR